MSPPETSSREALAALVDAAFDFVCTRRLADFIDPAEVLPLLDVALTNERFTIWQARLFTPQRERLLAHYGASDVPLGAWLPADVRAELEVMAGEPAPLPPAVVDEAIASERVRDEVRAMLQDTLSSFVAKALGKDDDKTGLRGALGRGAMGFAAAGKSLFGGLGEQVKKQLEERVRDFVDGSVAAVQTRIADKLKSNDVAETLGKRRLAWLLRTLAEPERAAAKLVRNAPHARIDPLIPRVVVHNLARPEVREALLAEGRAVIEALSRWTIGELLDEAGIREPTRELTRARIVPLLEALGGAARLRALLGAG